jgi:hypothetical protein
MMHLTPDSSFGVVLSLMKGMASAEQWKAKRVRIEHRCVEEYLPGNISAANRQILKDLDYSDLSIIASRYRLCVYAGAPGKRLTSCISKLHDNIAKFSFDLHIANKD